MKKAICSLLFVYSCLSETSSRASDGEFSDIGNTVSNCATHLSLAYSLGEPWMGAPHEISGVYGQGGEVYLSGTVVLNAEKNQPYALTVSEQILLIERTSPLEFRLVKANQITPLGPRAYAGLVDGEIRIFEKSRLFGWQNTNDMAHAFWRALLIPRQRGGIRPGGKPVVESEGSARVKRLHEAVKELRADWSNAHRSSQLVTSSDTPTFESIENVSAVLSNSLPMGSPLEMISTRSDFRLPVGENFIAIRALNIPTPRNSGSPMPIRMPSSELVPRFVILGITDKGRIIRLPVLAASGSSRLRFQDSAHGDFLLTDKPFQSVQPVNSNQLFASDAAEIYLHDLESGQRKVVVSHISSVANLVAYEIEDNGVEDRRLARVFWTSISSRSQVTRIYSATIDLDSGAPVGEIDVLGSVAPGEKILSIAASGKLISSDEYDERKRPAVGSVPGIVTRISENALIHERVDVLLHDGMDHPEEHLAPPFRSDSQKQTIRGRSPFQMRTAYQDFGLIPTLVLSRYVYDPE